MACLLVVLLWGGTLPAQGGGEEGKRLIFSGYEWNVKSGRYDPGDNHWSEEHAWVDNEGFLHLKIAQRGERWFCAEVVSVERFSYGSYEFQAIGALDRLDPNAVLGFFVYPGAESSSLENEIDIEFSGWGKENEVSGNYTVTAADATYRFPIFLTGNYTTHRFGWTPDRILFQSFHGHRTDPAAAFGNWRYSPLPYGGKMPLPPVHVHLNLWLFGGNAPVSGEEQEVIVKRFVFSANGPPQGAFGRGVSF